MAAAGPCPLQPVPVDLHAGQCAGPSLLLPGHRVPQRHANLQQCATRQHRSADRAHAQVLLLGCESAAKERHRAQGAGWAAARPERHPGHSGVHPAVPQAADYDRERGEGGRAAEHPQLPDDDARGREPARCPADAHLLDVRAPELDGACVRRQTRRSLHFQAAGRREPVDSSAGAQAARLLLVAQHSQVGGGGLPMAPVNEINSLCVSACLFVL